MNDKDSAVWEGLLSKTPKSTVYHSYDWLRIMEKYNNSELMLFAARKGEEYIGLFPMFYKKRFLIHTLFSPPQSLAVPTLGPIFLDNSTKQSEKENIAIQFIDLILDYLTGHRKIKSFYSQFQTIADVKDVRPFIWRGFDVRPLYTYNINLNRKLDSIMKDFSQSERRYLNKIIKDEDTSVETGNEEDMVKINNMVRIRYADQGISYSVPDDYLVELFKRFPNEVFVTKLINGGNLMSGMIYIKNGNTLSFWIGGTPPEKKISGANTLLHWWGIQKAVELELNYYEVMGANTEHLSKYKSKLNPELSMYFSISKKNLQGRMAEHFYKRFRKQKHK